MAEIRQHLGEPKTYFVQIPETYYLAIIFVPLLVGLNILEIFRSHFTDFISLTNERDLNCDCHKQSRVFVM